jgi:hypothetical protein
MTELMAASATDGLTFAWAKQTFAKYDRATSSPTIRSQTLFG